MIKRLVPLAVLVMAGLAPAQEQLVRGPENLSGSIQSIRIEKAELSNNLGNWVEGPRILSHITKYDPRGTNSESLVYRTDGSLYARYVATCNSTGQRDEETYFNAKASILDRMTYAYDGNGRLSEKVVYTEKRKPDQRIVLSYDANGRIEQKTYRSIDGKAEAKVTYIFDEKERKTESTTYDKKGAMLSTATDRYDVNGHLVERTFSDAKNAFFWRLVVSNDPRGNRLEETFHNGQGVSKWHYSYEFDSAMNWTKRITSQLVSRSGLSAYEPVGVTYRIITYNGPSRVGQLASPATLTEHLLRSETTSNLRGDAVKRVEPPYPQLARAARVAGKVIIQAMVDEQGNVISAKALTGPDKRLMDAATAAAWAWKFTPLLSGGEPVRMVGRITFNFNL